MDAHELRGRLDRHGVRDLSAHVAALRDVSRVPQALHQHDPGARDARVIPAGRRRLAREPITGDRRDHDVEGVLRAAAEGRGVGERADELDLLEDRAGPAVRDDDRQRALVLRTHVDEVDVEPVDLGDELRQGVELRLALAPVVVRRPVAREVLERSRAARPATCPRRSPSPATAWPSMRRRMSSSSASGTLTRKGRIAVVVADCAATACGCDPVQVNGSWESPTADRLTGSAARQERESDGLATQPRLELPAQRPEARAQLFGEELRLLPRREVTALVDACCSG